jgi:hypothetical protein
MATSMWVKPLGAYRKGSTISSPHTAKGHVMDGLLHLCWEMSLSRVVLASFIDVHRLIGVSDRCWPVEALAERLAYEGTRSGVVTAFAHVNVLDQLPPFRDGNAMLHDP